MVLQGENELEEDLLDQVQSCLGAVLEQFGDAAMLLMEGLMPQVGTLLTAKSSVEERRVGICVMDDIMEHTKEGKGWRSGGLTLFRGLWGGILTHRYANSTCSSPFSI